MGVAEKLAQHAGRETKERAAERGGNRVRHPPAHPQEGSPRRERGSQRLDQVVGQHRAEQRVDRPGHEPDEVHGGVPHQVDAARIVDRVREEEALAVREGVGRPAEKPDQLRRVLTDTDDPAGWIGPGRRKQGEGHQEEGGQRPTRSRWTPPSRIPLPPWGRVRVGTYRISLPLWGRVRVGASSNARRMASNTLSVRCRTSLSQKRRTR